MEEEEDVEKERLPTQLPFYHPPTQLPRYVGMLIKLFQVFYYIFLVVPSLDFMLEVKSSQKLMVPSVPFIENVDFTG